MCETINFTSNKIMYNSLLDGCARYAKSLKVSSCIDLIVSLQQFFAHMYLLFLICILKA